MIRFLFLCLFLFLLTSCGNIEFVLGEDNNENEFKNNTLLTVKGSGSEKLKEELFSFFGNNKEGGFILIANFTETKINRLVRKNQVAEKIDYELIVNYDVIDKKSNCKIFNKNIMTKFSFVPKSFGYNFGADRSLEKLYKRSIRKNINNFISSTKKNTGCL